MSFHMGKCPACQNELLSTGPLPSQRRQEFSEEELGAYILMQRIMPGQQLSVMTRQGQLQAAAVAFLVALEASPKTCTLLHWCSSNGL